MNRRLGPCSAAVAVSVAVVLAGCGSASPYAAKVDGKAISQDELESEMRSIAANEAYLRSVESRVQIRGTGQGTFDAAFTGQVLGGQILYVLINREVDRRKLKISDVELRAARDTRAQQLGGEEILTGFPKEYQDKLVERDAKVNALTVSLAGQNTSDDATKAYYNAHKEEFTQACVSHILVATREKADQLKARVVGGEDFGAVAKAESQDSLSAAKNGELGCDISADTVSSPEFVAAVMSQPIGEVGGPVQTTAGFHLVKVASRAIPPFEKVSTQARQKVVIAGRAKLQEWLEGAVGKAKITVDPRYGRFDKNGLTVVPPEAPSTTAPSTPPGSGIQPLKP